MWYNVRVKTYPDGHKQYYYCENPIFRWDDVPEEWKPLKIRRKFSDPKPDNGCKFSNNLKRAVNVVYDLARSNHFDWFITLTLSPEAVDRTNYDECAAAIVLFTKRLRRNGNQYVIVPELHHDGKSYHFHGLVQGDLDLTRWKGEVYNLNNFEFGYTTAMRIQDPNRVATYIAKYLTKDIAVPKGRKCYWASRSLARPTVSYEEISDDDFFLIWGQARYTKEIDAGEYGRFILAEE